jgi:hypothetical protein
MVNIDINNISTLVDVTEQIIPEEQLKYFNDDESLELYQTCICLMEELIEESPFIITEPDFEDFFDENETKGITIRYEIVFEGKSEAWQVWEALFDESGLLISVIKVQPRPLDNLVF